VSPMLQALIPRLLAPPDDASFDVERIRRSIRLAREAAEQSDTPLPSAELAEEVLSRPRKLAY
jgi:3-hydroxyisobutyrate dehydrogenase-like beta-hydroxyacid dehydrogenase